MLIGPKIQPIIKRTYKILHLCIKKPVNENATQHTAVRLLKQISINCCASNTNKGFKKCKIWPPFLTPVAFKSPLFWNGATYLKSKTKLLYIDNWPVSLILVHFRSCTLKIWLQVWGPLQTCKKNLINHQQLRHALPNCAEIDTLVHESSEAAELLQFTYTKIQDGRWHTKFKWLNCNNSAVDCPILLKLLGWCIMGPRSWSYD